MIIEQKPSIIIEKDGVEIKTTKMGIDTTDINMIMDMVSSQIYSDKPGSIIRELVSNSLDSSIESGNNTPVLASLKNNNGQWQFIAEDTGVGISEEVIENVIKKYFCSTKRNSENLLGHKGLGFKSPLSYKDYFQFQCRKDGVEILCMMRKGEKENEIDYIYQKETTEPNGVKVIVDVNYYDRQEFSRKMRTQLIYFDNVYIQDDYNSFDNTYKIYKNDLFSYSKLCSDKKLHLNFAGVYYPLDFDKLEISRIDVPVAINISLTDGITPIISRESIEYTSYAKEFLKNKIKLIADYFVTEYNKNEIEFESFIKAKNSIDNPQYEIKIGDEHINFKDLVEHAIIKPESIKIQGYTNVNLKHISKRISNICSKHKQIAEITYGGQITTKRVYKDIYNNYKSNKYILSEIPTGNKKEYLKENFIKSNSDIFKLDLNPVKLWFKTESGLIRQDAEAQKYTWYHLLNLADIPKKDWRALIQDAQKAEQEYIDQCVDLRDVYPTKEWLEARKEKRKYEGKLLDKQKGEITYYFTREKEYGGQMFDKKTVKISELGKEKKMIVYFTPDEKGQALKFWEDIFYPISKKNKLEFVLLNQREQKHVKNLHNYKNWKEFMETNKFKKLATKLKAQRVKNEFANISNSAEFSTIIETLRKEKQPLLDRIQNYIWEVEGSVSQDTISDLLKVCEENNLWDYEIMSDIKEMEKLAKEFEFLQYLKLPGKYDQEENKTKFAKYVAQYILFNKLYRNDFEQFEICVKAPIEETTLINEGELIPDNVLEYEI